MAQYIDKAALVAEIKRLIAFYSKEIEDNKEDPWAMDIAKRDILQEILSFLDTLEVKEVDLEKELDTWRHNHFHGRRDKDAAGEYLERSSQLDIAKHFFELGIKAQIMTSKLQQRISVLNMSFWTGLQTFEETEMTLSDAYNQGVDDILEELGQKAQKGEEV